MHERKMRGAIKSMNKHVNTFNEEQEEYKRKRNLKILLVFPAASNPSINMRTSFCPKQR